MPGMVEDACACVKTLGAGPEMRASALAAWCRNRGQTQLINTIQLMERTVLRLTAEVCVTGLQCMDVMCICVQLRQLAAAHCQLHLL